MGSIAEPLPDDVETLRTMVLATLAERDAAIAERDAAIAKNDRLRHLLHQANDALYGAKSERLSKLPPEQLQLALEDIEQAIAKGEAVEEKLAPAKGPKRHVNRGSLPAHLPRIHETIEPEDTVCPCCHAPMHMIGEEVSERLDVIPAQFRVLVTHRPKYACRACEGAVVVAPAPERLIKSGLPTEAMVAHVLVAKYGWHQPLYRQAKMFLVQGLKLDRSTLAFWVGYAAAELAPLHERMRALLRGSAKLAVDETPVPVLDPGRGRTETGYFWTMARDDRSWCGPDPPAVVYTYAPGRASKYGMALLADYRGIVQCDGYRAYQKLDPNQVTLAFCWAHLRRRFYDIAKKGDAPIATDALARIAAFYGIEETIRGTSADERRAVRQAKTKPLIATFHDWLEAQLSRVSAKAPIADAIRYGLRHWEGLLRFLDDGRIEIDNNIVERCMRPVALTRKNALFAGHDDGAENWAVIASLIETCKFHDIDPQAYLADVLTRLVNLWPNSRIDELLPWAWANARQNRLAA
jgi:transposase